MIAYNIINIEDNLEDFKHQIETLANEAGQ